MSVGAICFTSSGSNGGCWVVLVFPRLFFGKMGFFFPYATYAKKKSLRDLHQKKKFPSKKKTRLTPKKKVTRLTPKKKKKRLTLISTIELRFPPRQRAPAKELGLTWPDLHAGGEDKEGGAEGASGAVGAVVGLGSGGPKGSSSTIGIKNGRGSGGVRSSPGSHGLRKGRAGQPQRKQRGPPLQLPCAVCPPALREAHRCCFEGTEWGRGGGGSPWPTVGCESLVADP